MKVFLVIAHLCLLTATAVAAPASRKTTNEVTEQLKATLGSARSYVTSIEGKYRTAVSSLESSQADQRRRLNGEARNQERALELLNGQLGDGITELFTANTELLIIPSLVRFSEQLVSMTNYYREQSGFPAGAETLSCGDFCQFYQKRRDTLSSMMALLGDELMNISGVIGSRRRMVEQIARDIDTVRRSPNSSLLRFGFDHFINLRIALLESQGMIIEDINRLGIKQNFAGQTESVPAPCAPGVYLYGSLLSDLKQLSATTVPWRAPVEDVQQFFNVNLWTQGLTDAKGPLKEIQDGYVGYYDSNRMYMPGWLDNWAGCSQTKNIVLRDFQSKVEAEVGLGNLETAQKLEENTLELRLEVDSLNAQLGRLEQFSALLQRIGSIARSHAVAPESGQAWSDMWKGAVLSEIKNIERLSGAQREVLIAAQNLLRLSEDQLAPLGLIQDPAERSAQLFSVLRRLEVIAGQGFKRLELELSLAADSLYTMSTTIRSSEGSNNEGGLGLAITAYDTITSQRNEQMRSERDTELPRRRREVEGKVADLERSKASTSSLLTEIEAKQATLERLADELGQIKSRMASFFDVEVSHPFYLDLARKFISDLKVSKSSARTLRRPVERFLKAFSTTGSTVSTSSVTPATVLGKQALKLRGQYRRRLTKISDELSSSQLGGTPFSAAMRALTGIQARGASL